MHDMAVGGHPLLRPLSRACLALMVDVPYALEHMWLPPLLRHPVFEAATPAQLAAISALWSMDGAASLLAEQQAAAVIPAPSNDTAASHVSGYKREFVGQTASGPFAECSSGLF